MDNIDYNDEYNECCESVEVDNLVDDQPIDVTSLDEIIQKNISKNIRDLTSFFTDNHLVTEKRSQKTNIINMGEKKTYHVPDVYADEFFTLLENCRKEGRDIYYAERQETADQMHSGIMIDFDVYQRTKDVQINKKHFEALTRYLTNFIGRTLDYKEHAVDEMFNFKIFFIRKPSVVLIPPKVEGGQLKYKDGFHILIPELQVSKGYKRFLIQEMMNDDVLKSTFKDVNLVTDAVDVLDKMSCSVPVFFLGNTRPGRPAYNLTHAWNIVLFENSDDREKNEINVAKLLAGEMQEDEKEPMHINLTYELSLYFYTKTLAGQPTWLKKHQMSYRTEVSAKIQLLSEKTMYGIIDEEEINDVDNDVSMLSINNADANYLKQLLGMLDLSYATEYSKWFKVIMAIAHTSVDFKPLAIWFSHRKPESWSQAEIDRVWNEAISGKFSRTPVTKHSIRFWAQESSPQAFKLIDNEYYFNILAREAYSNEGRVEHSGAARVVHSMTWHKFIVDVHMEGSRPKYAWYEFVTPKQSMRPGEVFKWREESDPDNLHLFISEHLPKVYKQLSDNIKERKDAAASEGESKYWKTVSQNFKTSMSRLGNDGFQKGIISQCKYRFRYRGFFEELDSYEDIIGVGNGILKLGVKPVLIKGFHEYKISKYTTTNYVPFDMTNPRIQTLLRGLHDIWVEDDVFEFIMFHASTGLDHKEAAGLLLICMARGQNGKSVTNKLIHSTLGDMYCASGKASLLTAPLEKGNDSNSAQMQMRGKNFFYIDEFEPCSTLNTTRIKTMVSAQKQSGRDLYEKQSNFKNTANTVCYTNFDLGVETTDHGTWRRIYYYKNKMKFCENPDPNNPFEKKVDPRFLYDYPNDPLYLEAMLSILVHYYSRLCAEYGGDLTKVPVPTIKRETEIFRNKQDTLNRFITEMFIKCGDDREMTIQAISDRYIEWYNRTIKTRTGKSYSQDTDSLIENSRVAGELKRNNVGSYSLYGYRIRSYAGEPLAEGETSMTNEIHVPRVPTIKQDSRVDVEISSTNDDFDNLVETLSKYAPTHIQYEQKKDTEAAIKEFMDTL